jgi:hypothetical protein
VLATFDAPYVAAVKPSFMSKPLLRHLQLAPSGTDSLAKDIEEGVAHPRRWRT